MTDVTVLMPARNAQETLAETLQSLAAQTFKDFTLLLVNDASTDRTLEIVDAFRPRLAIEVLSLAENAGVAGALNQGLARIAGPYIARVDADDIVLPTRLEKQFAFLESHPAIDACSTWMEIFYDGGGQASHVVPKPAEDAAIKTALVQYCAMSHPATMFRKSFFDDVGVFDTRLDFAEDYDLWCRGALLGKRYANLEEVLTRYRQHAGQVGRQKRELQYQRDLQVKRKYISALLGGESSGYLAEFFHLLAQFSSREVAVEVIAQSMPLLLRLGQRVLDPQLYGEIVAQCMRRHLQG